jgi:hypothetical protein
LEDTGAIGAQLMHFVEWGTLCNPRNHPMGIHIGSGTLESGGEPTGLERIKIPV